MIKAMYIKQENDILELWTILWDYKDKTEKLVFTLTTSDKKFNDILAEKLAYYMTLGYPLINKNIEYEKYVEKAENNCKETLSYEEWKEKHNK